jgi:hypothetical protein
MCEWAICGNLCKHQVLVLLTNIDLTKENIIEYCGTWFGSNCGGFQAMFTNPRYLQLDDRILNDEDNEDVQVEEAGIIDMDGFVTMNVNVLDIDDISYIINELENSLAPMEESLFHLQDVMQEITNECKGGGIQLCDHATSLLKVVETIGSEERLHIQST